jgi:hypothetical protein
VYIDPGYPDVNPLATLAVMTKHRVLGVSILIEEVAIGVPELFNTE